MTSPANSFNFGKTPATAEFVINHSYPKFNMPYAIAVFHWHMASPHLFGALAGWVENGVAPEQILAQITTGSGGKRTRPLCPYPQTAIYKGSGSADDAANF